jgi:hypothetical protein
LAKVTSGVSNYVKKTLSILLRHAFVKSFSIHVEGLETERQLSVATFSSGKGIAQALTDGMMEWSGMFRKRAALRSAKRPMGSRLMRKTIRIPDSRCFRHVGVLLHGIGCSDLSLAIPNSGMPN